MNNNDVDRRLSSWLAANAPAREPEGLLDEVLARTAATRRRPGWLIRERWLDVQLSVPWRPMPRFVPFLVLLALLLLLLLVAIGVGGPRQLPAPFGLAGNGRIAYVSSGQVWTAQPGGNDARPITTSGVVSGVPIWSRDGTRLAFIALKASADASTPASASLIVAEVDGSRQATIDSDAPALRYASWAPDGATLVYSKWIVYPGQRDRIFVAPSDGSSAPRQIGDPDLSAFNPAYSPDGRRIAFVSDHNSVFGLHVMAADGSGLMEPTHGTYPGNGVWIDNGRSLSWSPDGTRILYAAGTADDAGLYVVPADGSSPPRRLADGTGSEFSGRWSPEDGREVVVVNSDGSGERVLATGVAFFDPEWSPDGWSIAVVDGDAPGAGSLRIVRASGGGLPTVIRTTGGASASTPNSVDAVAWQRVAP